MMNTIIRLHLLTKIQNDHHLLKFYLSESCKSRNNSQMYRFYYIRLWNGDFFLSYRVFYPPFLRFQNYALSPGHHLELKTVYGNIKDNSLGLDLNNQLFFRILYFFVFFVLCFVFFVLFSALCVLCFVVFFDKGIVKDMIKTRPSFRVQGFNNLHKSI
jgi:hypothetical protein